MAMPHTTKPTKYMARLLRQARFDPPPADIGRREITERIKIALDEQRRKRDEREATEHAEASRKQWDEYIKARDARLLDGRERSASLVRYSLRRGMTIGRARQIWGPTFVAAAMEQRV